jgi:DNA ligase (NAD+)
VVTYFSTPDHIAEVQELLEVGLRPMPVKVVTRVGHAFAGKIFVLTGTLESFSRGEAAQLIKERGGKTSSSVSKKTDFLLAGESAGSKLEKAEKLGVKILNEEEFKQMLQ